MQAMKLVRLSSVALAMALALGATAQTAHPQSETGYITAQEVSRTTTGDAAQERWDLSRIMAYQTWAITAGKPGVLVAILDTGIDTTNPGLAGKVIASVNFTGSPTAEDLNGHGTTIASIIAAGINETSVSAGLAYQSSLLSVKVAEDDGSCKAAAVAQGIVWAADNGAQVINVSLAIGKPSPALEEAVSYAWSKGSLIIAAAGNNFASTPMYPAAYPNVISVAATDKGDAVARWSNHGEWITIGAPGVDIYSVLPGRKYAYQSGTSFAAALVSGEAALLFSVAADTNGNGRANDEVLQVIKGTVDVTSAGLGRINALKAVQTMGGLD